MASLSAPRPCGAPSHLRRPHTAKHKQRMGRPAAAPPSPASPSTTSTLADWLVSRGALPSDGSVTLVEGSPPTLVLARAAPQPGTPILAVPEAAWISVESTRGSPALAGPAAAAAGLEPWARLALALLHARRDASDPLHAYAAALPPAAGDAPLFWGEDDLAELGGTQAGDAIAGYRSFFAARHASLEESLFSRDRDLYPADAYSAAHFAWAAATVRARVHPPLEGSAAAIVPGVDMVGHARTGASLGGLRVVAPTGGGGGVLKGLLSGGAPTPSSTTRTARLEAATPLPSGTPLTLDFGPSRTDGQLLLDYGALDEGAALAGTGRPGWALALAIPPGDRFADDKADILEGAGLGGGGDAPGAAAPPAPGGFALTLTPDFGRGPVGGPAAEDALAVLRLINLCGPDAFLLEPIFRAAAWGHMQAPISLANERAACGSMVAGCAAALDRLAGAGGEGGDEAALASGLSADTGRALSPRGRAATVGRQGERRSLASAQAFFEARAAGAEALEFYQERRLKGLGLLDEGGRTTYDSFFEDGIA